MADVLSGKFTWKVHNLSLFKEMIKTQKIMSPVFPAGDCSLRLSLYQSSVNGAEYLSMCLESKDAEKSLLPDRSCWCLFRMSVPNQRPGMNHMHRDSYGRFAADNKTGDNTSLGWNGYMKMADFVAPETGYLVEDTAVFSASFHVIKESSSFTKNLGLTVGRSNARKLDGHLGKFTWRIENFTRLKDLLKKRKITGLCVKSRRFQVGNRDCRPIVYPRGLQDYIQTLEASLQEEMSQHAPLYGAGLEALSMSELETLARIHEEELRQVLTLQQQQKGNNEVLVMNLDPLASHAPLLPPMNIYGTPPPMAVGMPSIIPNDVGIHASVHLNGAVGP